MTHGEDFSEIAKLCDPDTQVSNSWSNERYTIVLALGHQVYIVANLTEGYPSFSARRQYSSGRDCISGRSEENRVNYLFVVPQILLRLCEGDSSTALSPLESKRFRAVAVRDTRSLRATTRSSAIAFRPSRRGSP
jgi:hypothetical protein